MEFKGTKGNWELKKLTNRIIIGNSIADVWGFDAHINSEVKEEMEANALLISKAPEILWMLQKCERTLREVYEVETTEIKELIKQATDL